MFAHKLRSRRPCLVCIIMGFSIHDDLETFV